MNMTEAEQQRWLAAYNAAIEARRRYCTQPVTPANPVVPHDPGHRYSLSSGGTLPRR